MIRSGLPAGQAVTSLRHTLESISRDIDIEFIPLEKQVHESVVRERLLAVLGGGFGTLAAILAAVGAYGVLAYPVERRREEIGIRIALGAARKAAVGLVTRKAAILLAVGLIAAFVPARRAATVDSMVALRQE